MIQIKKVKGKLVADYVDETDGARGWVDARHDLCERAAEYF
jgi:hypothetical protein